MKRIIALTLSAMLLLSACGTAAPVSEPPELLEPVQAQPKTAVVRREDLLNATSIPGNIILYTEPVIFTVDGTLDELLVIPGQEVKAGDVLAALDSDSLQERLDTLLEQQDTNSYLNSLTNKALQADIDICQLKLDKLDQSHQAALAQQELTLATLREALAQLLQTGSAAVAAMEQELEALRQQLTEPEQDADRIREEIAALEDRIALQRQTDAEGEASATAQITELEAQLEEAKALQALERQLYEQDLQDAQLARKHAGQTQALAAKKLATQIGILEESLAKTTVTAPMDGIVVWITGSKRVTAEKPVIYIADPSRKSIRTEELSDYRLSNAEELYAIIGSEKYPLTYAPISADERIYRSLNDIPVYSYYEFRQGAQIPESMNALVFCVHGYRENTLCIPTNALQRDLSGSFVYKQEGGQRVKTYIQVGISTDLRTEVLSGLEEGDVVYVAE